MLYCPSCLRFVVLAVPLAALVLSAPACGQVGGGAGRLTPIPAIQGSGAVSPLLNQTVTTEGIVVGDFQERDRLNGFFIQDRQGDGDQTTSDGVFVYAPDAPDVAVGDLVRVTGVVQEAFQQTQIGRLAAVRIVEPANANRPPVQPVTLPLPRVRADQYESYEGMLVVVDGTAVVTENRNLDRFGEVLLAARGRLLQPTQVAAPGNEARAVAAANALNQLRLDDGSTRRNPASVSYLRDGRSSSGTLRLGTEALGLTGVLSYGFDDYRLQPTQPPRWNHANPRRPSPQPVGGRMKVATFNVLNYFNGDGRGGGFPTERGARSPAELARQEAKLVQALLAIDADVIGVQELENDGYGRNSAIGQLVAALNEAAGAQTYAFVDPDVSRLGTQPIAVGLIYRPGTVSLVGRPAYLDRGAFDPRGTEPADNRNRVPLAASFRETATGRVITVAVIHLKSKGRGGLTDNRAPDADQGDGQGFWNDVRRRAAQELIAWLATDPTAAGGDDVLVVGDLNAYAQEDPLAVFHAAGYQNLAAVYQPVAETYTNVYAGQSGSLDYILAGPGVGAQVTGATTWHINVDEPPVQDDRNASAAGKATPRGNTVDAYRSSDHDPIVVGLDLAKQPDAARP